MTETSFDGYSPGEERLNVLSHGLGLLLSIPGMFLLLWKAKQTGDLWHLVSFGIFGFSMILLYSASTFYHRATQPRLRYKLKVFDHAAIYVLIAGTYTPFALVTLRGAWGWSIFGIVWSFALVGVILKLFYTGRYQKLSTSMYVLMGWVMIIAIKPMMENLSVSGLLWILAGGLSYTVGAVFYSINRIKFNHAIFHLFVLFGTFCHYMAVFFHVVPIGAATP